MKTYVFGIGGTGARVIKSLVMLMSAGIDMHTDEIVPIFIDPDNAAADLTRTVTVLRSYQIINEHILFTKDVEDKFFKTRIGEPISGFKMNLANVSNGTFAQYMNFGTLSVENQALTRILFSDINWGTMMDVGFKGNPNIGSVVLNQFTRSQDFVDFAANFQQGDRIFIISSIFGGTGASGFPLLLKNLRGIDSKLPNADLIRNAPIGAITVLPYFNVESDADGRHIIDGSTFISKAKAALEYYEKNISGNNSLNAFYYIADDINKSYAYSEGGTTQQNDAHLVELLGALAVVDFCEIDISLLDSASGKAVNPFYKEFGINEGSDVLSFLNFYDSTRRLLQKPMTQFILFCKYMDEQLPSSKDQAWAKGKRSFDENFFKSSFYAHLSVIKKAYLQWLQELAYNQRGFAPFELAEMKKDVFGLVKGIVPSKVMTLKSNYALFDYRLSGIEPKISNNLNVEARFIELFYQATEKLVNEKKLA